VILDNFTFGQAIPKPTVPRSVSLCDFTLDNPGPGIVDLAGNAAPVTPVVPAITDAIASGTNPNLSIQAMCASPATAAGTYELQVMSSTGALICQSDVAFDVTITP